MPSKRQGRCWAGMRALGAAIAVSLAYGSGRLPGQDLSPGPVPQGGTVMSPAAATPRREVTSDRPLVPSNNDCRKWAAIRPRESSPAMSPADFPRPVPVVDRVPALREVPAAAPEPERVWIRSNHDPRKSALIQACYQAPMPVGDVKEAGATPTPASMTAPAEPPPAAQPAATPQAPAAPEAAVPGDQLAGGAVVEPVGLGVAAPLPRELHKVSLPAYVIEPPDILLIESTQSLRDQPIRGQHLVRPDGTVGLGIYGSVRVAGLTLEQARDAVAAVVSRRVKDFDVRNLYVDVLAYNSKFYYVITDGGGYGETVIRLSFTGSETVLDAIAQINGLPPVASKCRVWVARRPCGHEDDAPQVLPVNWVAITQGGDPGTNYQIMPGDRVYVHSDPWIRADTWLARRLSPIERLFGVTLLGSTTVNSIRGRTSTGF